MRLKHAILLVQLIGLARHMKEERPFQAGNLFVYTEEELGFFRINSICESVEKTF